MSRLTKFVSMGFTEDARSAINSATIWAISLTGRRMSNSDAVLALIRVAERHPDEVTTELGKLRAAAK